MTPAAFRAHLEALCWTQRGFAVLLGVAHNTVHRWALGKARIPPAIGAWLEEVSAFVRAHPPPR
jgi:DNA-binding transcriptional regulator YdaS (Cro superfamily)